MQYEIEINGARVSPMTAGETVYEIAAVVAVRQAGQADAARFAPVMVKIWVPHLVEAGYGPYTYRVKWYRGRLLPFGECESQDRAWEIKHDGDPLGGLLWAAAPARE